MKVDMPFNKESKSITSPLSQCINTFITAQTRANLSRRVTVAHVVDLPLFKTRCYILTVDRDVNQRCTYVNKRKKKWKQVDVMKDYRQMLGPLSLGMVIPARIFITSLNTTSDCFRVSSFGFSNSTRASYPSPSLSVGSYTRSNFKQGNTGINSEFSFTKTGCLTKFN